MSTKRRGRSLEGQPGYGGLSEGSVGEQGPGRPPAKPPDDPPDAARPKGPAVTDDGEDDEDDARDEEPKRELPKIEKGGGSGASPQRERGSRPR